MKHTQKTLGFTLIELIIVIAIIAILAASIFVAVDPARRLNQSRNSRRNTDVTAMLNALLQYQVDGLGTHVPAVSALVTADDTDYYVIAADTNTGVNACDGTIPAQTAVCPYLSVTLGREYTNDVGYNPGTDSPGINPDCIEVQELVDSGYIGLIPIDPSRTVADALNTGTGYYIRKNTNNAITFGSCDAEGEGDGGTGTPPVIEVLR